MRWVNFCNGVGVLLIVVVVVGVDGTDSHAKKPRGAEEEVREAAKDVYDDVVTDVVDDPTTSDSPAAGGPNFNLKTVTYKPIPQKFEKPTDQETLPQEKSNGRNSKKPQPPPRPPAPLRRGYYYQHYPWDRLPRRYLLRPRMNYVYPREFQGAYYKYPFVPHTDYYNIYRGDPAFGIGCGYGPCGPQGYQTYQNYYQSSCGGGGGSCGGGCGGGGGDGCSSSENVGSEEDGEESEKSGEARINKKDPLEDLDLEDLERIDKEDVDEDEGKATTATFSSSKKKTDDEELEELEEEKRRRKTSKTKST